MRSGWRIRSGGKPRPSSSLDGRERTNLPPGPGPTTFLGRQDDKRSLDRRPGYGLRRTERNAEKNLRVSRVARAPADSPGPFAA